MIELSKVNTSYVNQLEMRNDEIEQSYYDSSVSVQQFKKVVRDIIIETNDKSLEEKSTATKRFLSSLEKLNSKETIIQLVWNSRLNGDGLGVI